MLIYINLAYFDIRVSVGLLSGCYRLIIGLSSGMSVCCRLRFQHCANDRFSVGVMSVIGLKSGDSITNLTRNDPDMNPTVLRCLQQHCRWPTAAWFNENFAIFVGFMSVWSVWLGYQVVLVEIVTRKLLLPESLDLFFKMLLFWIIFPIFCAISLFLFTSFSLGFYCSMWLCFSPGISKEILWTEVELTSPITNQLNGFPPFCVCFLFMCSWFSIRRAFLSMLHYNTPWPVYCVLSLWGKILLPLYKAMIIRNTLTYMSKKTRLT